jgi:dihydroorotate dehydrogenase
MPWPKGARRVGLYDLAKPLLFAQDPERVHERAMAGLAKVSASPSLRAALARRFVVADPRLAQEVAGLRFPRPVGLAAGFDKSARAPLAWQALGFGFAELGTVTPLPQEGNPKPRMFRMPRERALVNRLGFNNEGASLAAQRLAAAKAHAAIPLGINVGKQRSTPLERAGEDYAACLDAALPIADFLVVNVSSPNTPGLRALQEEAPLRALLAPLAARSRGAGKPLFVKLDPDLPAPDLEGAVRAALDAKVAGIVATNTSARLPRPEAIGAGGVSGQPLRDQALGVLRAVAVQVQGEVSLVGVGGIATAEDAYARLRAGASLVEVYTGFVYGGPGTACRIHQGLLRLLERDGHARLEDAVGAALP